MVDGEDPAPPKGAGGHGRPSVRWPLWVGVAVLVVMGVIGVLTLGGTDDLEEAGDVDEAGSADDVAEAEPAGADEDAAASDGVPENLGVSPADLVQRWNDAVAALGAGRRLDPLVPTNSTGAHDLPASEQHLDGVGRARIVLGPDEGVVVMARIDRATPVGAAQERHLLATMQAGVSAATGLSPEGSLERLEADLDVSEDGMSVDHHSEVARLEGVTVGVFAAHGTWEFFAKKEVD